MRPLRSGIRGTLTIDIAFSPAMLIVMALSSGLLAASKLPEFPARQPRDCAVFAERGDVLVGIQPLDDPRSQETYFRVKFAATGVVPVFIVIQNGSKQESVLFDKTAISYGQADSDRLSGSAPDVTNLPGRRALTVGISPLFMSHDYEHQQNILKQEVRSSTISPGAAVHGFLYVPMPKGASRQKMNLRIPITKSSSDETMLIDLVF